MYPSVHSGRNIHLKVLIFFEKNGPDLKIGQRHIDDLKKYNYGYAQVFTQAETCIYRV